MYSAEPVSYAALLGILRKDSLQSTNATLIEGLKKQFSKSLKDFNTFFSEERKILKYPNCKKRGDNEKPKQTRINIHK